MKDVILGTTDSINAGKVAGNCIHPEFIELSEVFSRRVHVALFIGNFDLAKRIIDEAEEELRNLRADDLKPTDPIAQMKLGVKLTTQLRDRGAFTVQDLLDRGPSRIQGNGIGETTISHIRLRLLQHGYEWKEPSLDVIREDRQKLNHS